MNNYANYPALPPGKYAFAIQGDEVYYTEAQVREVQKQMARECCKALLRVYFCSEDGVNDDYYRVANFLEERFGPFDE